MKTKIINVDGKKGKEIELPRFFSYPIREDIINKVLEIKKNIQPYGPSPLAGKQHSASGKIVHRRHVWRSGYGRGISRVPRKIIYRKGSQFNWIAAEIASTRGGRRAHPPKTISMINTKKINKKELKIALISALSATANKKIVASKYKNITEKDINELPIIIDSKIISLKTKKLVEILKKILGKMLFEILSKKRKVRSGKGKLRSRKYKINAGLLIVTGKDEKIKTKLFDTKQVQNLGVVDLASGNPGRFTIYTENAIKELKERIKLKD